MMSLFWIITLVVIGMIVGIPLACLLWLIVKMHLGAHRLLAYTRMDELDALKIIESSESGFFDLAMPLARKFAEIALLFNYEAIRLLKRLESTEAIPREFVREYIEVYQERILHMQMNSSEDKLAISLTQYKFGRNSTPPKKFSPDATSALDAWHKFTQKQEEFTRMMRIYESTFRLNLIMKES